MAYYFLTERGMSRLEDLNARMQRGGKLSPEFQEDLHVLAVVSVSDTEIIPGIPRGREFVRILERLVEAGYITGEESPHTKREGTVDPKEFEHFLDLSTRWGALPPGSRLEGLN